VPDSVEPTTPEVSSPEAVVSDPPELSTDHPRNLSFREQLMRQWPLEYLERRDTE
jgi:hypothetical protein